MGLGEEHGEILRWLIVLFEFRKTRSRFQVRPRRPLNRGPDEANGNDLVSAFTSR